MPRKTKEAKNVKTEELEEKSTKKKTTTTKKATATKTSTKKSTTTKKVKTDKAVNPTKTTTKKVTKKSTTAKKTVTKSTSSKKVTKRATSSKTKKASTQSVSVVEYYDLPYRYNQTIVRVLAQTPTNLFVYWDISDEDRKNYTEKYGENFFETTKPVLIVHNNTYNYSFEIDINDFANSWYLSVKDAKCDYKVELGRRPISYNEKINTDYIYITTSNNIEAPNNQILLDHNQKMVYFRNVKTGIRTARPITTFSFLQNKGKFYSAFEWFQKLYPNETEDFSNLSNPSSGNPSSSSLSSKFK